MDQAEVRAAVRVKLGQDESNPDYWSDAVIDPIIENAFNRTVGFLRKIAPSLLAGDKEVVFTAANVTQTLELDCLKVESAWLKRGTDKYSPLAFIDRRHRYSRSGVYLTALSIGFAPQPISGSHTVKYDYQTRPALVSADPSGLKEIPIEAHSAVVLAAAIEAGGPETIDPQDLRGRSLAEIMREEAGILLATFGDRQPRSERINLSIFWE